MTFLLGRQATLGQAPPMRLSSMLMTRCPCAPRVQAMYLPASPLPMTIASYCSGVVDIRNSVRLDIGTTGGLQLDAGAVKRGVSTQVAIESHGAADDASLSLHVISSLPSLRLQLRVSSGTPLC